MTDAAIGELIGDRYVLVEHLRGGTTGDEWDAVDRRLRRHVIVSFAMPRSAMPVDDGDEPTMAMPVPVADRRRVLDGGVQDGRSYLVLEQAIDITAPTPAIDPDPTVPLDLDDTIDLRNRTEPTRPIAPRPDQQRTRVFAPNEAGGTRTAPTSRAAAPAPLRNDIPRRRRLLVLAMVAALAVLLVGSIAALAMARDGDSVDVTPSTVEVPVTTEAPPPTTVATTTPTTSPVTTRRPSTATTLPPTTTATTEPEATTETTVEPVGGIEPIVTAPTTVPAPVTTPAPIITVATTAAPTPTTALAIIEPSEPTVGEPAAGEPVAG